MEAAHGDFSPVTGTGNAVADAAWSIVTGLGSWRGTKDGCEQSADITKITVGKCTGNSDTTGNDVPAKAAVALNRWRNNRFFCVAKTTGSTF